MSNAVSVNLRIESTPDPVLVSVAALYGKGIFSTIAIIDRKPFLWQKHWRRLNLSAAKCGIDISLYSERDVLEALAEITRENDTTHGRARITFLDHAAATLWPFDGEKQTGLVIATAEARAVSSRFRLGISPYRLNTQSPLVGIKTCNYLDKVLATDEAKGRGFDEAVMLNEQGEIASAVMANIFWSKGGEMFTPALTTGCLPGVTREFVLENLQCREVGLQIGALRDADSIFLTSAGLGVIEMSEFDGSPLTTTSHPILGLIRESIPSG